MKKLLSILLVMALVLSGMTSMAFAGEEAEALPNFFGNVWAYNYDCVHKADTEVSVKITKEGMEDVVIPIPYDEEWEEYVFEGVVEGLDAIIKDVAPAYDAAFEDEAVDYVDALSIMQDLGYSVEVVMEDNDAEHEFVIGEDELYVDLLTYASVKASLDFVIEFIEDLLVEFDPTYVPTGSFEAFLKAYKEMLMDPDGMDMDKEDAEEALAEIAALEEMLAALASGEYAGQMTVSVGADCECPELAEYTLYHEYYDEEGEYVAQEWEFPRVPQGTVVKVEDLEYVTEYEGVEYEVEGVYLVDTESGEVDWENPVDEFTVVDYYDEELDEYFWTEVLVKYVPVSEDPGEEPGDEPVVPGPGEGTTGGEGEGNDDAQKPTDKPADKPADKEETKTPVTGDATVILPYVLLMAGAAIVYRKVRA